MSCSEVSLQLAQTFQVLEIHRTASVGSAGLHRRLHHAGHRRISLWQCQHLHLKHMPGLCSSVSTYRRSSNPPSAKLRKAFL